MIPVMVPEAPLEQTDHGLLPAGEGWFVMNGREAAWGRCEGKGKWPLLESKRAMSRSSGSASPSSSRASR